MVIVDPVYILVLFRKLEERENIVIDNSTNSTNGKQKLDTEDNLYLENNIDFNSS